MERSFNFEPLDDLLARPAEVQAAASESLLLVFFEWRALLTDRGSEL